MQSRKILLVNRQSPDPATIGKAAALIKKGGLVVFPTSSFYGLGTHALDPEAVDRVFRVKGRDLQKPLLILIASPADLAPLVKSIPKTATRLMEAFWPGGITIVFQAADVVPPNLTGHTGKVGIRLASHPVASALVEAVGNPVTGTSANLSGKDSCSKVTQLDSRVRDQVDMVLEAGELRGGKASTVVDVTEDPPTILRQGVTSAEMIMGLCLGRA